MSVIGKISLVAAIFAVVTAVAYVAGEIVGPPHLPVERQQVATVHEAPSPSPSPTARTPRSRVLPAGTTEVPAQTRGVRDPRPQGQHTSSPRRTPSPTATTSSAAPTPTATAAAAPTPTPPRRARRPPPRPTLSAAPTPTESPTPSPTSSETPSSSQANLSSPTG